MSKTSKKVSAIGGQAVLEGVMMRGKTVMATAVRDEYDNILISSQRLKNSKNRSKLTKLPIIRGIVAFIDSLINGTKILLKSAEVYGGDMGEPSRFEKWLSEKTKINVMDIAIYMGLILGLGLSIGLFFVLPVLITSGIEKIFNMQEVGDVWMNLIVGLVRLIIFVSYILLVSLMKDIRRTFMYHGAEHKTINCYEHDLEMNVANAQSMSTRHDRCGTSFLFIVMAVSVIVFSILPWQSNIGLRILFRLVLLPLVAGVSYEILKLLARSDNLFVRILKAPGLLLQKLTTKEPTDEMIEVAITSFNTVLAMEADESIKVQEFDIKKGYKTVQDEIKTIIKDVSSEMAEIDWILCKVTGKKRSELQLLKFISKEEYDSAVKYAKERATGRPLQYILGNTNFYGVDIIVDERVLIPRPETEILVENALKDIKAQSKVLDMCTGSGAIALAIAANSEATVIGSDISQEAVSLAQRNAKNNGLKVEFIVSDLFESVNAKCKYDIITINPPYIPSCEIQGLQNEVKSFEPLIALDGGVDGLRVIKDFISKARQHLSDKGILFMEIGYNQADIVSDLFVQSGYSIEKIKDLEGIDRIVKAVLNV